MAYTILDPSNYKEQCPIALETYENLARNNKLVATSCGHMFSQEDLSFWITNQQYEFQKAPSCPTCREPISERSLVPVMIVTNNVAKNAIKNGSSSSSSKAPNRKLTLRDINGTENENEAMARATKKSRTDVHYRYQDALDEAIKRSLPSSEASSSAHSSSSSSAANAANNDDDEGLRAAIEASLANSSGSSSSSSSPSGTSSSSSSSRNISNEGAIQRSLSSSRSSSSSSYSAEEDESYRTAIEASLANSSVSSSSSSSSSRISPSSSSSRNITDEEVQRFGETRIALLELLANQGSQEAMEQMSVEEFTSWYNRNHG